MAKNYKYTAADFERYHSGRMTETEMHALEKAALEDPFLADALEGYVYTTSPVKDINDLKEKLFAKKKKKNIFLVIQKQNILLRIAALFILIAGIGYVTYQLNLDKGNNELAKKEDIHDHKKDTSQIVVPKSDSINDQKETAVSPLTTNKTVINNENKKIKKDTNVSRETAIENSSDVQQQSVMTTPSQEGKRDILITTEKNLIKGHVVDSQGNPIQYAIIKDKNAKTIITSDSAGRFKMKANDSSLTANISAPGYKTEEKILSDKKEQVIVMEHDRRRLEEVVVTANGVKRQRKELSLSKRLESKVPGIIVSDSTLQPAGLTKFNEYVKENINIPKDEEGKNYKGQVVLSFEINKRGNPKKIKVEHSLCKPCDDEATRLLQHGPKWKYVNDQRQKVTIEF
ncbi:MAG TPA: carboxypeptidase-like regulatory domain-containing protein [Chitinophagaceae bacterium]